MTQIDQALRALEQAQAACAAADEGRREAMRAASAAGASLRQIEAAIDRSLSYEGIRTIVGARRGVVFEWRGHLYPITEAQTRALIDRAEKYGSGDGLADIDKYQLGTEWLPSALELAQAMRHAHVGTKDSTVTLDEAHARALKPLLQMTPTLGMTGISDLRERLFDDLGRSTPRYR